MNTIKQVEVGTLTVKLKTSYDVKDNFIIIKEELDNNSVIFFEDQLDEMIKALQDFKNLLTNK